MIGLLSWFEEKLLVLRRRLSRYELAGDVSRGDMYCRIGVRGGEEDSIVLIKRNGADVLCVVNRGLSRESTQIEAWAIVIELSSDVTITHATSLYSLSVSVLSIIRQMFTVSLVLAVVQSGPAAVTAGIPCLSCLGGVHGSHIHSTAFRLGSTTFVRHMSAGIKINTTHHVHIR